MQTILSGSNDYLNLNKFVYINNSGNCKNDIIINWKKLYLKSFSIFWYIN